MFRQECRGHLWPRRLYLAPADHILIDKSEKNVIQIKGLRTWCQSKVHMQRHI